jgi:glucokinase
MDTGSIELLTNLTPDWNGFAAQDTFRALTGLPVWVLNDVWAATLAEHVLGAGQGYSDFICIAVGTGIGGGLVLDGRLFRGSRGAAGEIGHFTVVPDGQLCTCGNRGCLETVASATALAREARAAIAAGHAELVEMTGSETPSAQELAIAAERGSGVARELFAHAGRMIGLAAGSLICVLNPQAVVVGGGVARAGDLLLGPIREEIAHRTVVFLPRRGGVEVLASPMGGRAGAMGAAAWAMQPERAEEGNGRGS